MEELEKTNARDWQFFDHQYDKFKAMPKNEWIEHKIKEKRKLDNLVIIFCYTIIILTLLMCFAIVIITSMHTNEYHNVINKLSNEICNQHNMTFIQTRYSDEYVNVFCDKQIFKIKE